MEFTLDRPDVFPAGTAVGLYHAGDVVDRTSSPPGEPIQTVIVGDTGETEKIEEVEVPVIDPAQSAITFTELETRNYLAGAQVGGVWHYVRFAAGELGASLEPPARYPNHGV